LIVLEVEGECLGEMNQE